MLKQVIFFFRYLSVQCRTGVLPVFLGSAMDWPSGLLDFFRRAGPDFSSWTGLQPQGVYFYIFRQNFYKILSEFLPI